MLEAVAVLILGMVVGGFIGTLFGFALAHAAAGEPLPTRKAPDEYTGPRGLA